MKKFAAVILTLALVLSMVCVANAEQRSYVLVGFVDGTSEEGFTEIDPEQVTMVMAIDDEAMACTFGTEEATAQGTLVLNGTEGNVAEFEMTLDDGNVYLMAYDAESDLVYINDAANERIMLFVNIETLAE